MLNKSHLCFIQWFYEFCKLLLLLLLLVHIGFIVICQFD